MYTVVLEPSAQRDLRKLRGLIHDRVTAALRELKAGPRPYGVKKLAGSMDRWRVRVSDYRILYEIDDVQRLVHVCRVAHRSEAYR